MTKRTCACQIWNIATGKLVRTLDNHTHNVSSVCFAREGNLIVTGSWDRVVRVFEFGTGKVRACLCAYLASNKSD